MEFRRVLFRVLVLRRLKRDFPEGLELAGELQEVFFEDMDSSLREMGAGDLGVGQRVKRMAEGFMGRLAGYEAAIDGPAPDPVAGAGEPRGLATVLCWNVFGARKSKRLNTRH